METKDITAIIPIRIDSEDRIKNIITAVEFLLHHYECNIIIKELDFSSKITPPNHPRVKYIFEKCEENAPFHRTRLLNDMLLEVTTPYVINYDCDMLIPTSTMKKCKDMLIQGYDLVYPYPKGAVYYTSQLNDAQRNTLISKSTEYMDYLIKKYTSENKPTHLWYFIDTELDSIVCAGGMQFFNTQSYKNGFGENESFIDWGPEDYERLYRFYLLGYKIGWIDSGNIFHMDHKQNDSSLNTNKNTKQNTKLWSDILSKNNSKKHMLKYMTSLEYVKTRNF